MLKTSNSSSSVNKLSCENCKFYKDISYNFSIKITSFTAASYIILIIKSNLVKFFILQLGQIQVYVLLHFAPVLFYSMPRSAFPLQKIVRSHDAVVSKLPPLKINNLKLYFNYSFFKLK